MANVSAFGFGGYDFIGSAGEAYQSGNSGLHFLKKSNKINTGNTLLLWKQQQKLQQEQMEFQSALNQKNQIWSAHAMPSATVEGLRAAGLNPLLAYSDFSGLASSGAMGVSPASLSGGSSGGTVEPDFGSGTAGFDSDAVDKLRFRKQNTLAKHLANKQTEAAIAATEAGTAKSNVEAEKTKAEASSAGVVARRDLATEVINQDAQAAEASAREAEAQAREMNAEAEMYHTARRMSAETGVERSARPRVGTTGTDANNQFWNDYYREQMDRKKYENSALRSKVLDSVHVGKEAAGAVSDLMPSKKVIQKILKHR